MTNSPLDDLQRGLRWRLTVLVTVFGLGLLAFCSGVELSERGDVPSSAFLTKVYYTLGLFVFGGVDFGVPTGGPAWAQKLLWFVYFAAPAIMTTALVEGALLALRPQAWRLRRLRNHTIVGGCGRLAMLYLRRIDESESKPSLLVVDNRAGHPNAQAAGQLYGANVITGDLTSGALLKTLNLERAQRAVLLTGDDYVNLDAASRILKIAPQLSGNLMIHISDIRLLRVIEQKGLLPGVKKFNSYRMAAVHLVEGTLLPHFKKTEGHDVVVLAGFGRFGQTVLHQLQEQACGQFEQVVIVDSEATSRAMVFSEQVGFDCEYRHSVIDADLRHPETWRSIQKELGGVGPGHEPVFVLGTGDDGLNIRTALWLSGKFPGVKLVARCFRASSFTDQISRECEFDVVSTSDLLMERMTV